MLALEDQYILVRDYLYENPYESADKVSEETGVPPKVILYFIRDGRIQDVRTDGLLRCEQCGKPIDSGRFCKKCMSMLDERMIKPMQQTKETAAKSEERRHRMYTQN
jgi:hypothetical protein